MVVTTTFANIGDHTIHSPSAVQPVRLSRYTMTSCLGSGLDATLAALRARSSGLAPCSFETVRLNTHIGEVAGVDDVRLAAELRDYDCRNNRLAELALRQDGFDAAVRAAIARHGRSRIGVFLGTSTSGILQTELAYRRRDPASGALPPDFKYATTHNSYSLASFVRRRFALSGPATVISTACSSGAKVFAAAARLMAAGVIDAAIVGGVDSLCLTTLYGFNSLELLSPQPCRPFDAQRNGISIGEAAGFILLEASGHDDGVVLLLGAGESSDAHHMSSPHPDGLGARMAMEAALASASLRPDDVDYINLHGTATQTNDAAEDKAVFGLFGERVPVSSTKGATGHTLGAAGAIESVICALALTRGFMPGGGVNMRTPDPRLNSRYLIDNEDQALRRVLSNSFGFGGTNCALLFGVAP